MHLAPPSGNGIQIHTLREHKANTILTMDVCGMFRRGSAWPGDSSTIPSKHLHQQHQQLKFACSENEEQRQGAMVCNTAATAAKRPFFDSSSVNGEHHPQQEHRLGTNICRQHQRVSCERDSSDTTHTTFSSTGVASTATALTLPSSTSANTTTSSTSTASACNASNEDSSIYDPEALLLEPLLNSPRSERENAARVRSAASGGGGGGESNNICDSVHMDGRIMSQSISGNTSLAGVRGWENTDVGSSSSSGGCAVPPALLSRPLVPVSPALSGASGSSMPSYIPGCGDASPRSTAQQQTSGGGSGGGTGEWYLNFPPHQQQQQQPPPPQPQHHQHHHHHHHRQGSSTSSISGSAGGGTSSATHLAMAAANVAAAVHQASGAFSSGSNQHHHHSNAADTYPPSLDDHSMVGGGGSTFETLSHEMRPASSSSWPAAGVGSSGESSRLMTSGGQHSNIGRGSGIAAPEHQQQQRPRFVTREECLPGVHQHQQTPRHNNGASVVGHSGFGEASEWLGSSVEEDRNDGGVSGGGIMHMHGSAGHGNDSMYLQWPSSDATSGGKRLHSQIGPDLSSSAAAYAVATGGLLSAADAAAAAPAPLPTMAARLPPMTLHVNGGDGAGGKRLRVHGISNGGAATGPQGSSSWPPLAQVSSRNTIGNGWRSHNTGGLQGSDVLAGHAHSHGYGGTAAIAADDLSGGTPVPDSNTPRRRLARGGNVVGISAAAATAAARAALAAAAPPTKLECHSTEDDEADSAVGEGEGGSGGDSSLEWAEKDESEEDIGIGGGVAGGVGGGGRNGSGGGVKAGRGGGSGSGVKSKAPFMLDPKLWVIVERRAVCTAKQCAYRSEDDHRARRRHYHALCSHVHQNGERKGMRFQHHQLEKVQKHQRAHQVSVKQNTQRATVGKQRSPSGSPVPRNKRSSTSHGMKEQTRAIKDANVEAHSPKDWTPDLTKRLRDLVDELGPKWASIADKIPGKTATACMLHWRVGLNPHHMVKGSGTWTAEEDERLSKLVEVVGMKWSDLARHIPGRIAKQCRERYLNHLDPSLRKDMPWTEDEEALLMRLCFAKQNQWAEICRQLHGRSYNDVKNRFNLIQRRNKRAQGSPTPPTPANTNNANSPAAVSPSATATANAGPKGGSRNSPRLAGNGNGNGSSLLFPSGSNGVPDGSGMTGAPFPRSNTRGRGDVTNTASAFAPGRAAVAAIGGWGPAAAAAAAAASAAPYSKLGAAGRAMGATTAQVAGGASASGSAPEGVTGVPPFGLMGDELGEFGMDGPDSASPGSGFAPGGYWHQMVKEETKVTTDSDEESEHSAGAVTAAETIGAAAMDVDEDASTANGNSGTMRLSLGDDSALSGKTGAAANILVPSRDTGAVTVDPSPNSHAARFSQSGSPLP